MKSNRIPDPFRSAPLRDGLALPLVVQPDPARPETADLGKLLEWVAAHKSWIDDALAVHGGLLFRGFAVAGPEDFQAVVSSYDPALLPYVEGQSQRSRVTSNVYTSTEYPPSQDITMHNELSYVRVPPRRLYFFCEIAPEAGGETPIADCRRVYERIDPAVRSRFMERGVRYVKNMHGGKGFGKSWHDHFETSDRSVVEEHLTRAGEEFRWKPNDTLWTSQKRPAAIAHPETGETTWFNQADLWHYSNLGGKGEALRRTVGEEELPTNSYFGDGTPIDPADLAAIREVSWREATVFPWSRGDLLILDNILASHGRKAFTGPRRILVAMT